MGRRERSIPRAKTPREGRVRAKRVTDEELEKCRQLLLAVPKTEIHVHLEGLASVDTVWSLIQKNRISIPDVGSEDDIRRKFNVKSLREFIDLFLNVIQNAFREEDDVKLLFDDARTYLQRNRIVYAEIHFAPSMFLRNGHNFERLMAILDKGAAELSRDGLEVRFIIDVSRTFGVQNAMQNLELTLRNRIPSIVGIGLGGQETTGPAREFARVFERAREAGLHVVAHAGEAVGPESVRDAVEILCAERIGHGISSIQDPSVMDLLHERRIPLEVCPSSNLFTGHYATTLRNHPIGTFLERGLWVTVNTDDPTIFGVDLVDEYLGLIAEGVFDLEQTMRLVRNGVYASFLPAKEQDRMWREARSAIEARGYAAPS
jgi:adenosine deaminase